MAEEITLSETDNDVLGLIFTVCHPALPLDARMVLVLKTVLGLSVDAIAHAFRVSSTTMAKRVMSAKRSLTDAGVRFEMPVEDELPERLSSVLEVIHHIFFEGYTATAGDKWARAQLCEEAMRLGRVVAALNPTEPEAHSLVALMEIQASTRQRPCLVICGARQLADQDRSRWDWLLITHAFAALDGARTLGPTRGLYGLQAEIAACQVRARRAEDTDWVRIASLYGGLMDIRPAPVVRLNRAIAIAIADGPDVGLAIVNALADEPALRNCPLLPIARANLLAQVGKRAEARGEFERAASMTANARERALWLARAAECR